MTSGSRAAQVARDGAWASWAPTGRAAVPAIVLLVVVANLVGVATVVALLIGVEDGSSDTGRGPVLWAVAAYLAVALPAGTVAGLRRQRVTNRWLMARREPTDPEDRDVLSGVNGRRRARPPAARCRSGGRRTAASARHG